MVHNAGRLVTGPTEAFTPRADAATSAAYAVYGLMDQIGVRLSELMPPEADPAAVAAAIARIVSLPHGSRRSARSDLLKPSLA